MIKRLIFFVSIILMTSNLHAEHVYTSTEYCQSCHDDQHLQAKTDAGTQLDLFVDQYMFRDGSHQSLECVECHQATSENGLESFKGTPHKIKSTLACNSCHQQYFYDQQQQFKQSVHYQRAGDKFTCQSCHNPHTEGSALWTTNKQQLCMDCHTKKVVYESLSPTHKTIGNQDLAHVDALPFAKKHLAKLQCLDCHADINSPHNIKAKENTIQCTACHSQQSLLAKQPIDSNARRFLNKGLFDDTQLTKALASIPQEQILQSLTPEKEKLNAKYLLGKDRNKTIDNTLWFMVIALIMACALHGMIRYKKSNHRELLKVERKVYLYTLPVRVWHWLNALCFIILIITGGGSHYGFEPLNIYVSIHNFFGFTLIFAWLYFITLCLTGNGHHYYPKFETLFSDIAVQTRYYLSGIFNHAPHPFHPSSDRKFNPLQQLGYIVVMFGLLPALITTGISIYWSNLLPEIVWKWQTKELIATLHVVLAFFSIMFLVFHLYLITTGRTITALLKGMKDGYHRE